MRPPPFEPLPAESRALRRRAVRDGLIVAGWLATAFVLVVIVVFGGATLILQDETFIKWKPTVLYWLFGGVLAGAIALRRNLVRTMLSDQVQLPDAVWRRLNWSWVAFFAFMGALNLYVAYNYSTDNWVNFKLFGGMGLMLVFVVAQAMVLSKYIDEKKPADR